MISDLVGYNPDAPDLVAAIAALKDALWSRCEGRTAAVAMGKVSVTLQIASPPQEALEAYYEVFSDFPGELVEYAAKQLIKHHKYPSYPKPADWLQYIEPAIQEKLALLNRLERMQKKIRLAHRMTGGRNARQSEGDV